MSDFNLNEEQEARAQGFTNMAAEQKTRERRQLEAISSHRKCTNPNNNPDCLGHVDVPMLKVNRQYQVCSSCFAHDETVECNKCHDDIPLSRKKAAPGVRICIDCKTEMEQKKAGFAA